VATRVPPLPLGSSIAVCCTMRHFSRHTVLSNSPFSLQVLSNYYGAFLPSHA
jgi:hypothetical protein